MSVIYLKHPVHGRKVATMEEEAKYDETKGWTRYDAGALLTPQKVDNVPTPVPSAAPVTIPEVVRQRRKRKEQAA